MFKLKIFLGFLSFIALTTAHSSMINLDEKYNENIAKERSLITCNYDLDLKKEKNEKKEKVKNQFLEKNIYNDRMK